MADCIVTRNGRDFQRSPVPVFTPGEFVKKLEGELSSGAE